MTPNLGQYLHGLAAALSLTAAAACVGLILAIALHFDPVPPAPPTEPRTQQITVPGIEVPDRRQPAPVITYAELTEPQLIGEIAVSEKG